MKLLKRLLLAGIAVVILLGLTAYFTIKIAFPPQKIRQLVREQGKALVGREVGIGDVSIRLFPNLMVSLQDVQLANAPGFSREPAIQLREIILSINFMSLIRLSPDINEIKLVHPEILFEVNKAGQNNFEGLGGEKKSEPKEEPASDKPLQLPAAMAMRSFVIYEGRIRYLDAHSKRELILDRINQKVSLELDPNLRNAQTAGLLQISEVKIQDAASGLRKGNVSVSLKHDLRLDLPGEKLRIKTLELGFQDTRLNIEGEITHFTKGPVELDVKVVSNEIRLASILKEIPASLSPEIPKLSLSGTAHLDLAVKGKLDSQKLPSFRGTFKMEQTAISHSDLPVGIQGFELALHFADDTVELAHMGMQLGENPIKASARLHGWQSQKMVLDHFKLNAAFELEPLISLAQKMGMVSDSLALAGLVKAVLEASGPIDPANPTAIQAIGQVDLNQIHFQSPALPVAVKVDGTTRLNNDRITQNTKVTLGNSDVEVQSETRNWQALVLPKQAKGVRANIQAKVTSKYLDLDELKPKSTAKDTSQSPPLKRYPELPPMDATVEINLARTHLLGLDMTAFKALAKLSGTVLTTDLKGQLYTGGFTSGLKVDLKDSTQADVGLKLNLNKVEANDFISRINDQVPGKSKFVKGLAKLDSAVFGKFNLNMDVQTSGLPQDFVQNLSGAILFFITDGKILETGLTSGLSGAMSKASSAIGFKDMTFGLFKVDMLAENGQLVVKDANMKSSSIGTLVAKGNIGFDNSLQLQLDQTLPPGPSKILLGATSSLTGGLAQATGISAISQFGVFPKNAQGQALLYYTIGGTVAHPEYKMDTKRMASEANSGAKAALNAALDEKKAELTAKLNAEKEKIEALARAKADSVKKALETKVEAEKNKAVDGAKTKAKEETKKALKNFGL